MYFVNTFMSSTTHTKVEKKSAGLIVNVFFFHFVTLDMYHKIKRTKIGYHKTVFLDKLQRNTIIFH